MSGQFYAAAKNVGKTVLKPAPPLLELAKRFEQHAKGHGGAGHAVREVRLQLHRPHRRHDLDSLIPTLENIQAA